MRLDPFRRTHFLLVHIHPEGDHFTSRMCPAQSMSDESPRGAGIEASLPPYRRTGHCFFCGILPTALKTDRRFLRGRQVYSNTMSTAAIISASTLDASKVSFGDIRMNKAGGKTVPIKYNGQSLQIRIPKAVYPMGINIRETENGSTYQMALTLKGCDVYAKDKAGPEAGDYGCLYNFLLDMQTKLLDVATANSAKWFGRSRERAVLQDLMKQFLSPSVEKVNGEWVPDRKSVV